MPDPVRRRNSHQIEGVVEIPSADFIPFQGGMDTYHEIYQLPLFSYSDIHNMRPLRPGFVKRSGYTPLHTTADATNKCMQLYVFSKGKQSEVATFAQMSDGDVLKATNNPPTVTTGVFGTASYTSASAASMYPASFATVNDIMLYTDGTSAPCSYSGSNEKVTAFIVYKGAATIPDIPLMGNDYSIQVTDDDDTTYADVSSLSVLTDYDAIFIKTETPADTFAFTLSAYNGTAAVFQLHYWSGSWSAVSGLSDGTATAGAAFAKDGSMTWTMTTDHVPHYMFGSSGYWYRLSLASGALDSQTRVLSCKWNSDFMKVSNIWDGIPIACIESYFYINSTATYEYYSASGVEMGGATSSDKVYVNSLERLRGLYASVGAIPNATASTTATIKYWNGTAFATVGTISDATIVSSKSHASDGWITWTLPSDEQPTMFQSSTYYSYWYEISFNQTITADMIVSYEGMPVPNMTDFGKCYALSAFKQRIAYSFERIPGYVAISSTANPATLNGSDYAIQDIGDGRANIAVCLKRFYNELLVWQEEKGKDGGCLTLIEGTSPANFGKRVLSTVLGTFSSKSAVVVENVPVGSSLSVSNDGNLVQASGIKTVAIFLSRAGVYLTDGKNITNISGKIHNHFDPNDTDCIRRGYEKEHWIEHDTKHKVVRVGLVTGSSATVPNTYLVYDYFSGDWSYDSLANSMSSCAEVESASGNYPVIQISGGSSNGLIYLMNYGTSDNGTAIDAYCMMEIDGRGHRVHIEEITLRVSGSCTLTPYHDGTANTAITIT
jgi:hypothetical protein